MREAMQHGNEQEVLGLLVIVRCSLDLRSSWGLTLLLKLPEGLGQTRFAKLSEPRTHTETHSTTPNSFLNRRSEV
jgi:hypothetical protein